MNKYLERYAEQGTAAAGDMPEREPWRQVVVIPVCNESTGILRPLPEAPGRSLMIVVVNEPDGAPETVSKANRAFATEVAKRFRPAWQSAPAAGLALYTDPASNRDVLLVDRFSEKLKLPIKGGVGHARKAGADLAAYLFSRERVLSPWIHCSDADVELPRRYFMSSDAINQQVAERTAALIYPFRHGLLADSADGRIEYLTRLYEYSLRYYVAGLKYARSPYAFHTIGSTLAVNATHYCKVRGFPRRQAGEDFYLLNKLGKSGDIHQFAEGKEVEPIRIDARLSDRVPFGTGAAVTRMAEMEHPDREFLLYHPEVFTLLRGWLISLPVFWQKQSDNLADGLNQPELAGLVRPLEAAGAPAALHHALQHSSDETRFLRHMHTWFDAFRTLKLIHYLRDHHCPSLAFEALAKQGGADRLLCLEPVLPRLHEMLAGC